MITMSYYCQGEDENSRLVKANMEVSLGRKGCSKMHFAREESSATKEKYGFLVGEKRSVTLIASQQIQPSASPLSSRFPFFTCDRRDAVIGRIAEQQPTS